MKTTVRKLLAIALTLFGLITVFISSSVIFDLFGIREMEGNYVLFIVVSNFICGLLYLLAAYGLFFGRVWTTRLLVFTTVFLSISFAGLIWHIFSGGIYEPETVKAMVFRIAVTLGFTGLSWKLIPSIKGHSFFTTKMDFNR